MWISLSVRSFPPTKQLHSVGPLRESNVSAFKRSTVSSVDGHRSLQKRRAPNASESRSSVTVCAAKSSSPTESDGSGNSVDIGNAREQAT
jgi:hypothetical protein